VLNYKIHTFKIMVFNNRKNKGFTLIELLVVIAIIGILSSVVLASLNTAREKSRDAKRVSDIKQLQLALELYYDTKGEYPDAIANLLTEGLIPAEPVDPLGGSYPYNAYTSTTIAGANDCTEASETCIYYHLGASLENLTHAVVATDDDTVGDVVDGPDADGCANESARACYAVTP